MTKSRAKILVLVEGHRLDAHVMRILVDLYGISEKHEIVSYDTNIYTLYAAMFKEGNPDDYDLLQILKEREKDESLKYIFDQNYSDILLVFDLDPQDPVYTEEKIREMLEYFSESTDKGKLYLNYPMIESFYHMNGIPDNQYCNYIVSYDELKRKLYKDMVHELAGCKKLDEIFLTREECNYIIYANLTKARNIVGSDACMPEGTDILESQLKMLREEQKLYVLSTCPFYIVDYNPNLIK